jgi:hypothetical protein
MLPFDGDQVTLARDQNEQTCSGGGAHDLILRLTATGRKRSKDNPDTASRARPQSSRPSQAAESESRCKVTSAGPISGSVKNAPLPPPPQRYATLRRSRTPSPRTSRSVSMRILLIGLTVDGWIKVEEL